MTEKEFFKRAVVERVRENAGTRAAWSWASALGDTVMEKFESIFVKLIELTNVLEAKGAEGELWLLTGTQMGEVLKCSASFSGDSTPPRDALGILYHGMINKRWRLWIDSKAPSNQMLLGAGYDPSEVKSFCAMTVFDFEI